MKKLFAIGIILAVFTCRAAVADDVRFESSLEMSRVSVGNPVYLYLSFYGAQGADAPDIREIEGLKIRYVGPATKVSVVNGKVSQSVTHTYLILPRRAGRYTIGPFSADYEGRAYNAGPVTLTVKDSGSYKQGPSSLPSAPAVSSGPQVSPGTDTPTYAGDNVFLRMHVPDNAVYVNEIVPLTIKLYVNDTGLKEISFPEYPHEGFSAGELNEPQRTRENYRGQRYDVLVFRQDIFGIKEGDYSLGPAELSCKMMVARKTPRRSSLFGRSIFDDDFFSSRVGLTAYPIDLESNAVPMSILPFPEEGKPAGFRGAVGDFSMEAGVNTSKVKEGDPVVLKMEITGTGNLDTVTAPRVDPGEGFKTYEPQVSKKGTEKIYEQIFIPKSTDVKELPEVSFSFFDPGRKVYRTVSKGPFPIQVMPRPESERGVRMVTVPGGESAMLPEEKLGQDIIHIKYDMGSVTKKAGPLYRDPWFILLQVLPLAALTAFYVSFRKKERILTDRRYARSLRAPRKARKGIYRIKGRIGGEDPVPFYDEVFRTLQDYLGDRFDLPKGSVTSEEVAAKLGPDGRDAVIPELKEIFQKCEMARYAPSAMDAGDEEKVFESVKKIIDHFERIR